MSAKNICQSFVRIEFNKKDGRSRPLISHFRKKPPIKSPNLSSLHHDALLRQRIPSTARYFRHPFSCLTSHIYRFKERLSTKDRSFIIVTAGDSCTTHYSLLTIITSFRHFSLFFYKFPILLFPNICMYGIPGSRNECVSLILFQSILIRRQNILD